MSRKTLVSNKKVLTSLFAYVILFVENELKAKGGERMSDALERIDALEKRIAAAEDELRRLRSLDEEAIVQKITLRILQAIQEQR